MLDLNDFITERGGDPKKIKESQRRRGAPEEVVDEVIALYEEARKGMLAQRTRQSTPGLTSDSPLWSHPSWFPNERPPEADWHEEEGSSLRPRLYGSSRATYSILTHIARIEQGGCQRIDCREDRPRQDQEGGRGQGYRRRERARPQDSHHRKLRPRFGSRQPD